MAFIKEYRSVHDELPEWEYLNAIGVRNMFGRPINKFTQELVVDRDNNYYLIPQGHTGRAYTDEDVNFYALCLKDQVINMEVLNDRTGNYINKNSEIIWTIRKIILPESWSDEILEGRSLKSIIEEAFIVATYNRFATKETVKSVTVNITADIRTQSGTQRDGSMIDLNNTDSKPIKKYLPKSVLINAILSIVFAAFFMFEIVLSINDKGNSPKSTLFLLLSAVLFVAFTTATLANLSLGIKIYEDCVVLPPFYREIISNGVKTVSTKKLKIQYTELKSIEPRRHNNSNQYYFIVLKNGDNFEEKLGRYINYRELIAFMGEKTEKTDNTKTRDGSLS